MIPGSCGMVFNNEKEQSYDTHKTWIDLKIIMLRERSHPKKSTYKEFYLCKILEKPN